MAEAKQYTVTLNEIVELIIKKIDIHDGQWNLLLGLQVGVGKFGPTPEQTFPGASVAISQVGIQRVEPGTPIDGPGVIVVDAAKVNPAQPPSKKEK